MKTLPELVAQSPVFSHLKSQELARLSQLARSREYQKGEWIAHYGDDWPYLFVVESGTVTAVKESEDGRTLIIMALGPGEIFWGAAFFQRERPTWQPWSPKNPAASTCGPTKSCVLLSIHMPRFPGSWQRLLVRRMQRASDIVEELAFQPVAGRLAKFLLSRFGESAGERVTRNLTLDEMAAHIGSTT